MGVSQSGPNILGCVFGNCMHASCCCPLSTIVSADAVKPRSTILPMHCQMCFGRVLPKQIWSHKCMGVGSSTGPPSPAPCSARLALGRTQLRACSFSEWAAAAAFCLAAALAHISAPSPQGTAEQQRPAIATCQTHVRSAGHSGACTCSEHRQLTAEAAAVIEQGQQQQH